MASGRPTLKQIARRAGVSAAVVSNVLNGKGRMSDAVRGKVRALLEESGHRPKIGRKPFVFLVGLGEVIGGGKTGPFVLQLHGLQRFAAEANVELRVEFVPAADDEVAAFIARALEARPTGMLVPTDVPWARTACEACASAGVPVVQLGYDTEDASFAAVVVDSFAGAYAAAKHLAGRGHSRIATIRWPVDKAAVNSNKKFAGFSAGLADAGVALPRSYVRTVDSPLPGAGGSSRARVDELLALREPPTAVFVENSFVSAPLLYPTASDRGGVPRAVRALEMVHFEDWPLEPVEALVAGKLHYDPSRTTVVAIDWEEIGRLAARHVIDAARAGRTWTPTTLRVMPRLEETDGATRRLVDGN